MRYGYTAGALILLAACASGAEAINPLDPVGRSLRQSDFALIFAPAQHMRWYPKELLEGLLP